MPFKFHSFTLLCMWNDVIQLRDFYEGELGQSVSNSISRRINNIWDNTNGMRVLGIGFATPYLDKTCSSAERKIAAMPAAMGVIHWPSQDESTTILGDETSLPFPDCFFDRVIIVHSLESTGNEKAMLRELWRITAVGGKVISIVPNRLGIWAMLDGSSPFGRGAPYTIPQIFKVYSDNMFTPKSVEGALFSLPFMKSPSHKLHSFIESIYLKLTNKKNKYYSIYGGFVKVIGFVVTKLTAISKKIFKGFAGVLIVEAEKQSYSVHAVPSYNNGKNKIAYDTTPSPSANRKQKV